VRLHVLRSAAREFDGFSPEDQAQFVNALRELAEQPDVVLSRGVRHLAPGQAQRAGAAYYIKARKDRCVFFNRAGDHFTVVHLTHRNDRRFFKSEW
jgi:hypothetical protein